MQSEFCVQLKFEPSCLRGNYASDCSVNLGCLINFYLILFLRKRSEYGHLTTCKKVSTYYLVSLWTQKKCCVDCFSEEVFSGSLSCERLFASLQHFQCCCWKHSCFVNLTDLLGPKLLLIFLVIKTAFSFWQYAEVIIVTCF